MFRSGGGLSIRVLPRIGAALPASCARNWLRGWGWRGQKGWRPKAKREMACPSERPRQIGAALPASRVRNRMGRVPFEKLKTHRRTEGPPTDRLTKKSAALPASARRKRFGGGWVLDLGPTRAGRARDELGRNWCWRGVALKRGRNLTPGRNFGLGNFPDAMTS